jgi:hypothetical protein
MRKTNITCSLSYMETRPKRMTGMSIKSVCLSKEPEEGYRDKGRGTGGRGI